MPFNSPHPSTPPPHTHTHFFKMYIPGRWPVVAGLSPPLCFPLLFFFFNKSFKYIYHGPNIFLFLYARPEILNQYPSFFWPPPFKFQPLPPPPPPRSGTTTEGHLWSEGLHVVTPGVTPPWREDIVCWPGGHISTDISPGGTSPRQAGSRQTLKTEMASGTCGTSRSPARCHLPYNTHLCTGVRKGLAQRWFEIYSHG